MEKSYLDLWYRIGYLEGVLYDLAYGSDPITAERWSALYQRDFPDTNGLTRLIETFNPGTA